MNSNKDQKDFSLLINVQKTVVPKLKKRPVGKCQSGYKKLSENIGTNRKQILQLEAIRKSTFKSAELCSFVQCLGLETVFY